MDLHYRQEVGVGALVLVALTLFVVGTMWLSGRSLGPSGSRITIQVADAGTLKRGNPVKVSGVTMGAVESIAFEEFGRVLIGVSLSDRIVPKMDASAKLTSIGLVGDMQIELNPGTADTPLPPGQIIIGSQDKGLMTLGSELGEQAKSVMSGFEELASERLADDLHETLEAMQRMMNTYSDTARGPAAEMQATMRSLQQLSGRLDSTLANPDIERFLAHADSATARLAELATQFTGTAARLDTLLSKTNAGEGTLGRMANDTTLYVEMTETTKSLRKLLDELTKNPGKITVQVKFF